MAINEIPIGVYTDVAGIIAAGSAAEIVALFDIMLTFIPDPDAADATTAGVKGEAPEYDNVPPSYASNIREEITALRAAIAAAPTA